MRRHNSDDWPDSWTSAVLCAGPGYRRFPLAIPAGGALQFCIVEIMATGGVCADGSRAGPTVVLHEFDRPGGPGLCNRIEDAVAIVTDTHLDGLGLDPAAITWILHDDAQTSTEEWTRLTVRSTEPAPVNPLRRRAIERFVVDFDRKCLPVGRAEDPDLDDDYFSPAVFRPLELPEERPELKLDSNTCHERRTGVCSVSVEDPVDDERHGLAGWSYCRELADLASLWRFIEDRSPGWLDQPDLPTDALTFAQESWRSPCGTIAYPTVEYLGSCQMLEHGRLHVAVLPNGRTAFSDGQHRWCSANHARVDLPVLINLPGRRKHEASAP